MYYSTALFKHANLGTVGPYATIGVGVTLVLTTLVSGSLMDKAGRRTLHLLGLSGTCLCSILLTVTFLLSVNITLENCFYVIFPFRFSIMQHGSSFFPLRLFIYSLSSLVSDLVLFHGLLFLKSLHKALVRLLQV
jgi:hypothetical protein